jgi:hypothetical protein
VALTLWSLAALVQQQRRRQLRWKEERRQRREAGGDLAAELEDTTTTTSSSSSSSSSISSTSGQWQQPRNKWWEQDAITTLLADIVAGSAPRLGAWQPQDLSTGAWALSRLGFTPPDDWLRRLYARAARTLPSFSNRELANLAWGLLRLRGAARPPVPFALALRDESTARRGERALGEVDRRSVGRAVAEWLRESGRDGGNRMPPV